MKRNQSKKQLSIRKISAAKYVSIHSSALHQIKGGVIISEDILGF